MIKGMEPEHEIHRRNSRREREFVVTFLSLISERGGLGMIEIILTVCAIANPSNCEEKYLQFTFDGSIQQCMMAAQPYIAQWIGNHPEWMATKWSCDYPGHEKRRI
jgi:hypothetical protein